MKKKKYLNFFKKEFTCYVYATFNLHKTINMKIADHFLFAYNVNQAAVSKHEINILISKLERCKALREFIRPWGYNTNFGLCTID